MYQKSTIKITRVNEESTTHKHLPQRKIGICEGKGNLWNLKKLPKANAFLLSCQALFERLTKTFGKKTTKKTIIL